jgi:hypothetical protein
MDALGDFIVHHPGGRIVHTVPSTTIAIVAN